MARVLWNKVNILVVEDEDDLRDILVAVFEGEGCRVHAASNGREALKLLETTTVDLVVSDVRMPYCDGIKLLETIRERNPDVPIVFLATGYADLNEEQAKKKGAASLISKPFSIVDLFRLIETHLVQSIHFTKVA